MGQNNFAFICFCFFALLNGAVYAAPIVPFATKNEVMTMPEQAKRRGPLPVAPVENNKVRYDVLLGTKGQDGGVIAAIDSTNGKTLWTKVVYTQTTNPSEEKDVQEVYVTKLSLTEDKSALRVENEAHKAYLVNLTTHEVLNITGK